MHCVHTSKLICMNQQDWEVDYMSARHVTFREMKRCESRYEKHCAFIFKEKKSPGEPPLKHDKITEKRVRAALINQCSVQRAKQKRWHKSRKSVLKKDDKHVFLKWQKNLRTSVSVTTDVLGFVVKSIFKTWTWMQTSLKSLSPALQLHANKLVMQRTDGCNVQK